MKKSTLNDSQVDAIAFTMLVVLVVAFAVTWVAGQ